MKISIAREVKFSPVPADSFEIWRAASVRRYADGKVRADVWDEKEALSLAEKEYLQVLPQGLSTTDHHFCLIEDASNGKIVGSIWFQLVRARPPPRVQLWDMLIDEEHRREGYATVAMRMLENEALMLGADKITLGVFTHNLPAVNLYEKIGYSPSAILIDRSAILMSKEIR